MLIQNRISTTIGRKKEVLKFRSVNNIVIAPAKTGKDNNNKIAVNSTDKHIKVIYAYIM